MWQNAISPYRINNRMQLLAVLAIAALPSTSLPSLRAGEPASRQQIDALVKPLLDGELVQGLVVGLVQPRDASARIVDDSGIAIVGYGQRSPQGSTSDSADVPDADTLFEIGSVSKPVTGLILAEMVERGEVTLDEPVARLLPEGVKVPVFEGREITLLDLITHTSALPRLPKNLAPKNLLDPYVDYTADKMFEFLGTYELRRRPGEKSVYSNLGVGLLGEALSRRAGRDYEALLRERICQPLAMNDTRVVLDQASMKRLAPGHDAEGRPIPNWNLASFVAAGGIRSTARDMVRLIQANLYLPDGTEAAAKIGFSNVPESLQKAMALSQEPRHKLTEPSAPGEIALAWIITPDGHTLWHNGETGGYHSYLAFDRSRGTGVVVLTNSANGIVDSLGVQLMRLLAGESPEPLKTRVPVKLQPELLDTYVGHYNLEKELGSGAIMEIGRDGDHLRAKLSLQPRLRIYAQSENEFFYKSVDAQITFNKNAEGKISGLVLHQDGKDFNGPRVIDK